MTRTPITVNGRTYEFVRLDSIEELGAYRDHWSVLVERDVERTIFSSPEMFVAHRKAYPGNGALHIVFVQRDAEVVACAPMVIAREKLGRIPCRILRFYMRRADCVAPHQRGEIGEALAQYWRTVSTQWDVLALEELRDGSDTLRIAEAAVHDWPGCRSLPVGPTGSESFLPTDGTWEEYTQERSRHFRKRWNRLRRYFDEMEHAVLLTTRDPAAADAALGQLFAIEERSWKVTGGARLTPGEKTVFLELARGPGQSVSYEVSFIEVEGEKIAGLLSYFHFDRVYLFLTFFDQRQEDFSPGRLLIGTCVEQAFQNPAIREASFVGSFASATYWSSSAREYRSVRIYGRTLAGRLAYLADRRKLVKAA